MLLVSEEVEEEVSCLVPERDVESARLGIGGGGTPLAALRRIWR